MKLDVKSTWLLDATLSAATRYIVHEGGTRSSKTVSLCQYVILDALAHPGRKISIARKTFPALRVSVMEDFFETLNGMGLYKSRDHQKTLSTYTLNRNTIEFMSVDDAQKKRGSKRNILWLNEANELSEDDARQLFLRTKDRIILDYNPSGSDLHWIRRNVLSLGPADLTVFRSTYLDNPFLPEEQIREIERLKDQDPVAWSVFGLGIWAQLKGMIYTDWKSARDWPKVNPDAARIFGLDFGYTAPLALVEVYRDDASLYWRELIYESGITSAGLIARMDAAGVRRGRDLIYCDAAEPDRIAELVAAGFRALPARKDVMAGINFCRGRQILVVDSGHIEQEIASYKMRQVKHPATGEIMDLEEPLKVNDHAMDAARYATYTHYFVGEGPVQAKVVARKTESAGFKKGGW